MARPHFSLPPPVSPTVWNPSQEGSEGKRAGAHPLSNWSSRASTRLGEASFRGTRARLVLGGHAREGAHEPQLSHKCIAPLSLLRDGSHGLLVLSEVNVSDNSLVEESGRPRKSLEPRTSDSGKPDRNRTHTDSFPPSRYCKMGTLPAPACPRPHSGSAGDTRYRAQT